MNLVSNFIGSISPNMFGNMSASEVPNINFDDNRFAELLERQINDKLEQKQTNFIELLGLPSNMNISDFTYTQKPVEINTENSFKSVKPLNEFNINQNNIKDMSTSEVVTFFNSLFDSKPSITDTSKSGLFDFERKTAANQYSKYSQNIVTDLNEFVVDTMKIKS